jgi:hypothetical protein
MLVLGLDPRIADTIAAIDTYVAAAARRFCANG